MHIYLSLYVYYLFQAMLYTAVEQAPSPEVTEESAIIRYYGRFDEQFFRVCDKELAKINTFFSGKHLIYFFINLLIILHLLSHKNLNHV